MISECKIADDQRCRKPVTDMYSKHPSKQQAIHYIIIAVINFRDLHENVWSLNSRAIQKHNHY